MSSSSATTAPIHRVWPQRDPIWTPYFNIWNQAASWREQPFDEHPWKVPASSTSGAPFLWTGAVFVGLLGEDLEARFAWDGEQLRIEGRGDLLFVRETNDYQAALSDYHAALDLPGGKFTFGKIPEYCTWVEQFWVQRESGAPTPAMALHPDLVHSHLDYIASRGWPAGRFTVDDGWCPSQGPGGYGDWRPRPGFDMAALADRIRSAGHIPGLWMAPALISPTSDAARAEPALLGERVAMGGECAWNLNHYLRPGAAAERLIGDLFRQAFDWGYRKFKLDIFYGEKPLMNAILRICRDAADALPEPVELEGHVPDPFSAQYCDVIRTNDVLISAAHPNWRNVAREHVRVCRESAPKHLLNLDHIGGNAIDIDPDSFLEHIVMMHDWLAWGYPVISLLPARYGQSVESACAHLLVDSLNENPHDQNLTSI